MLTCLCHKCLAEPLLLPGLVVKSVHLLPAQLRNFTETLHGFAVCEICQHLTASVSSGHQKSSNTEVTLWVHLLKLFLPQPITLSLLKKTCYKRQPLSREEEKTCNFNYKGF